MAQDESPSPSLPEVDAVDSPMMVLAAESPLVALAVNSPMVALAVDPPMVALTVDPPMVALALLLSTIMLLSVSCLWLAGRVLARSAHHT